jgi:hypothetical protein
MFFDMYKRSNNGHVQLISELSGTTTAVNTTALQIIAERVVARETHRPVAITRLATNTMLRNQSLSTRDFDRSLIRAFVYASALNCAGRGKSYAGVQYIDPNRKKTCGMECEANNHSYCNSHQEPAVCEGYSDNDEDCCCPIVAYEDDVDEHFAGDTVSVAYNKTLLRTYRDTSLGETWWGTKMMFYYYFLGQVLDTCTINLPLKLQTTVCLYNYISTVNKVLNEPTNNSDTLLPQIRRVQLLSLIGQYHMLSGDSLYNAALSDIEADIIAHGPKTIGAFLTDVRAETEYLP